MSKNIRKSAVSIENELASLITEKVAEEVKTLMARNWPQIKPIFVEDQGVKLSFKVDITNRESEPGEHADADKRVRVTIAFGVRHSDSIDAALPDPTQPELPTGEPDID